MAKFDKKLATILTKYGLVAEESRDEFLAAADQAGVSLTEYLVDKEGIGEADIIGAVSVEMNIAPINMGKVEIEPEALELIPEDIAKLHGVLPIARIGNTLTLAVANPMDVTGRDNINVITGCDLMPVLSTDVSISTAIQKAYNAPSAEMDDLVSDMGFDEAVELAEEIDENVDIGAETDDSEAAPVVKLVNLTIMEAVKAGAAGIHIEPYENKVRVRYRIDGTCIEKLSPPKKIHNALTSRIKIMSSLDIAERRRPQDGKFKMRFGDRDIDFRVSILPLVHGEKIVLRILDTAAAGQSLETLGFEQKSLKDYFTAIESANGMILAVGPTGCGKTTTLYAAMKKVICVEDNITTVEDPVEYTMEGVNQVQVNERRGLTFARALRSILRQDPDKVLIGEIRDLETAEIATKAALTGHLVFSTVHANDAPATITRLVNMGVDSFLIASTMILVSAQRLVRRLCPECKRGNEPTEKQMRTWGFTEEELADKPELFIAAGCSRCGSIGYKGRLPLIETLPINAELREIMVQGGSALDVKRKALEQGMLTLRRVGILSAIRGDTSMQEVLGSTMSDR